MLNCMLEIQYEENLRTRCKNLENGQELVTDAPKDNMGKGEFFSPTDLLGAALGSCVLTLMGIAANRLKVSLSGLRATVSKEMAALPLRRIGKLTVDVYCPQVFDPEVTQKIEAAGSRCPVHQSLHPDLTQIIRFHWGKA